MDRHRIDERDAELKAEAKEVEAKIGELGDRSEKRRKELCERLFDIRAERKRIREERKYTDVQVYSTIGEADQGRIFGGDDEEDPTPAMETPSPTATEPDIALPYANGVTADTPLDGVRGMPMRLVAAMNRAGFRTVGELEARTLGPHGKPGPLTLIRGINPTDARAIECAIYDMGPEPESTVNDD